MTVLGIEESERGVIFAPGYSYTRLAEIKIMYNTLMTTQYKAGASTRTSHTNTKKTHDMTHMYSKFSCLRNREIETETLIFAPISLSYIEID